MLKCMIHDLIQDVAQDYPIVNPFWKNFAKNADIGYHIMLRILKNCVDWYDIRRPAYKYGPTSMIDPYEFHDNFQEYLDGYIDESQIELIPTSIIRLGYGAAWTSADQWDYREPYLYGSCGMPVEYTHKRKLVCSQAPDDWFTEDSCIYFLEDWDEDFVHYFNQVTGMVINEAKKSVNFGGVEFLGYLDTLLQDYQADVKRSEASDLVLMRLWR